MYIILAYEKSFDTFLFHVTEKIKLKFGNILVLTIFSWTRHAGFLWNTWENWNKNIRVLSKEILSSTFSSVLEYIYTKTVSGSL